MIDVSRRMKRWWYNKENGSAKLTVRVGPKKLGLAEGKDIIALASVAEVVSILTVLMVSV